MTKERDNPIEKTWNTDDLDFDEHGRLIIKNKSLQKMFLYTSLRNAAATAENAGELRGGREEEWKKNYESLANELVTLEGCIMPVVPGKCFEDPIPDAGLCKELFASEELKIIIRKPEN